MRYRVYYIPEYPIDRLAPLDEMRVAYNDSNPDFVALKNSISEQGMLNPVFAQHINGKMCVSVGKQRVIACQALHITHIPVMFWDYDGMGIGQWGNLFPVPILTEEEGQAYFADDVKFTLDRFVSVTKNVQWREQNGRNQTRE